MKKETRIKVPNKLKEKIAEKENPILFSYTLKALISTGPYSNIQPEITVGADTIEEAYSFVEKHMDELHAKYFNFLEKKPETPKQILGDQNTGYKEVQKQPTLGVSHAYKTAFSMIEQAYTYEALSLIGDRVKVSDKLTEEEKKTLIAKVYDRQQEFIV